MTPTHALLLLAIAATIVWLAQRAGVGSGECTRPGCCDDYQRSPGWRNDRASLLREGRAE